MVWETRGENHVPPLEKYSAAILVNWPEADESIFGGRDNEVLWWRWVLCGKELRLTLGAVNPSEACHVLSMAGAVNDDEGLLVLEFVAWRLGSLSSSSFCLTDAGIECWRRNRITLNSTTHTVTVSWTSAPLIPKFLNKISKSNILTLTYEYEYKNQIGKVISQFMCNLVSLNLQNDIRIWTFDCFKQLLASVSWGMCHTTE
jgi:hypothetical protein